MMMMMSCLVDPMGAEVANQSNSGLHHSSTLGAWVCRAGWGDGGRVKSRLASFFWASAILIVSAVLAPAWIILRHRSIYTVNIPRHTSAINVYVQQCQQLLRSYGHNHSSHLSCPGSQFIHAIENSKSTWHLFNRVLLYLVGMPISLFYCFVNA